VGPMRSHRPCQGKGLGIVRVREDVGTSNRRPAGWRSSAMVRERTCVVQSGSQGDQMLLQDQPRTLKGIS
jgi:hypothetical protein